MTRTYTFKTRTRALYKGYTIISCRGGFKIEGQRKVYRTLVSLTDTL
jgi:hypothetical protein